MVARDGKADTVSGLILFLAGDKLPSVYAPRRSRSAPTSGVRLT